MAVLDNVIVKPLITEKISFETETANRYGFKVSAKANKNQIKNAVERFYNVKVLNVNTAIMPGKIKRAGRSLTKTPKWKKAIVQIEEGQKIELFKGV